MCRSVRVLRLIALSFALLIFCAPGNLWADDLDRIYQKVLQDPLNVELNLSYAKLAESLKQEGKAVAAYERVLAVDTGNAIALAALKRIRVALAPVITHGRFEIGARYETNVRQFPASMKNPDDFTGFANLFVRDQRPLLGEIWRSDMFGYFDLHDKISLLDFWYVRAHTGPIYDLGDEATIQIAPGGALSFLNKNFYFKEPAVRFRFEKLVTGVLDRLDIRVGYRDVDKTFGNSDGLVLDVVARSFNRSVLTSADAVIIQPFFRIRKGSGDPSGGGGATVTSVVGDYMEMGGNFLYYILLGGEVRAGATFVGFYRKYRRNVFLMTNRRHDYFIAPGAEILFRNVACRGCDLSLKYRFEKNFSNDKFESFKNHLVSFSAVKRF